MVSSQEVPVTKNRLGNVHPVLCIGSVIAMTLLPAAKVSKRLHTVNFDFDFFRHVVWYDHFPFVFYALSAREPILDQVVLPQSHQRSW